MKEYNDMIDSKKAFDQPTNNDIKTYENIRNIATGKRDHAIGCLSDYRYFKKKLYNYCNRFK